MYNKVMTLVNSSTIVEFLKWYYKRELFYAHHAQKDSQMT